MKNGTSNAGHRASAKRGETAHDRRASIDASVFVLGVLHDLHQKTLGYTYWHLQKLLAAYAPDLITIEVGSNNFATGDFRCDSPEKWGVILPWGRERGIPVVATDGSDAVIGDFEADSERAMAELLGRPGAKEAIDCFKHEMNERLGPDPMPAYLTLIDAYAKANSSETSEFCRWSHARNAEVYGEGILTGFWDARNRNMARRTVEAMTAHGARRAIVTVGCEHKYALDDLFRDYGLRVLQLGDFLGEPISLTEAEIAAFHRGEVPITYPSDLMFLHRKLHGGEPDSYNLALPANPASLDLTGVADRIERALSVDPGDSDMLFYHGLLRYAESKYRLAAADFDLAAGDRSRWVAGWRPLWQLALLRAGQMLDLAGERVEACARYHTLINEGAKAMRDQAHGLLEEPYRLA